MVPQLRSLCPPITVQENLAMGFYRELEKKRINNHIDFLTGIGSAFGETREAEFWFDGPWRQTIVGKRLRIALVWEPARSSLRTKKFTGIP